jgi:hypothetical protein
VTGITGFPEALKNAVQLSSISKARIPEGLNRCRRLLRPSEPQEPLYETRSLDLNAMLQLFFKDRMTRGRHGELLH